MKEAPEDLLPAEDLEESCYEAMFSACSALEEATMHGVNFKDLCCSKMFFNCSNLAKITVDFETWGGSSSFDSWVSGVSSFGNFYATNRVLEEQHSVDTCPSGWRFHLAPAPPLRKKVEFSIAGMNYLLIVDNPR